MCELLARIWDDDRGAVIAAEWILVATILIIGAITGFIAVRQAILAEVFDLANHVHSGAQSYGFTGQADCEAATPGSQFITSGDSILVKSTAATTGGFDNHACD
jgi:hypothetical protein